MRIIDNLEELKVGDYIHRNTDRGDSTTYKILSLEEKVIKAKVIKKVRCDWRGRNPTTSYPKGTTATIPKLVRKTKKKKLKHKVVTYNDYWVIFKLTEKEKRLVIREEILKSLK